MRITAARLFGAMVVLGFGAVAAALVSQHVFGMEPCPWCALQRAQFVAIALAGLLGLAWRATAGRVVAALLALALALTGAAAALWQHFVAARTQSCNLTLADRILSGIGLDRLAPDVFAPRASCADAAVDLLGISYDFWSLALFVVLGAAAVAALRRA